MFVVVLFVLHLFICIQPEGVLVCAKDVTAPKHLQLEVPNLHVVKLMQSMKSRGLVKEVFNWQYLYYILTDEGIEYLREHLHISEETVPNTLKKASKPQPPPSFRQNDDAGRGGRGGRGKLTTFVT